jgi:hypothetical protein
MKKLKDKNIQEAVMYVNATFEIARKIELRRKHKPSFQEMCKITDLFGMGKVTRRAFNIIGQIIQEAQTPTMFIERIDIEGEDINSTILTFNAFPEENRQYLIDNYAAYMESQGWIFKTTPEKATYTTSD